MKKLVYERELNQMKFSILTSAHHREAVEAIARHLGIPLQRLRRVLIERLDMMSLEALAIRYETWTKEGDQEKPLHKAIGYELYTIYIPLIPSEEMEQAVRVAESGLERGLSLPEAAGTAIEYLREGLS